MLTKNSSLLIKNVSLNNTRTGIITVLKEMGADIQVQNEKEMAGENFGDIFIKSSRLHNIEINEELIPNIIDEIPILAVAGVFAEGEFKVKNAYELRGKESDRISAVCSNMKLLGLTVDEFDDGFSISGKIKNTNLNFESFNDHRIAMAFSVLSLLLKEGGKINNFHCVNISNPNFLLQLKQIIR